jgi:hypothetical protein
MGLRVCERNSICHELVEEVMVVRTVQRFAQCITVIIFGVNLSNINYLASHGFSQGFIASPTILSTSLLLMSLYPMAEHGSCNNHQQQQ